MDEYKISLLQWHILQVMSEGLSIIYQGLILDPSNSPVQSLTDIFFQEMPKDL